MASSIADKIGYFKDRCVNAFWMLRRGELGLIVKNAGVEFKHRFNSVSGALRHNWIIFFRTIRIRFLQTRHKVSRIGVQAEEGEPVTIEDHMIEEVIPDSAFKNRRKLLPPTPGFTQQRLHTVGPLKADGAQLLSLLETITAELAPTKLR